jgi:hypothetical protein
MTKYNAKKTIVQGIKFDSQMEADYFLYLLEQLDKGEVLAFVLQPKFEIHPAFEKRGIKFRKIEYNADFGIITLNGENIIIDVKGTETAAFKLKSKMFERKFPQELKLVTRAPKKFGGGWIEVKNLKQLRKQEKKNKK